MKSQMVFTVIAKDRPGLVDQLAAVVVEANGNWLESSMARLGGEFAGIVRIEVEPAAIHTLQSKFEDLSKEGIMISLRSGEARVENGKENAAYLEIESLDHPGILHQITQILNGRGVSIDQLETTVTAGSMSGESFFKAKADLRLPYGLDLADVRDDLQSTAADLMADINFRD